MTEDESIAAVIRLELYEGLASLVARRRFTGHVVQYPVDRFGATTFELTGRFAEFAETEVTAVVEVDPARVGWRIEAALYVYRDDADAQQRIRELGSARVIDVEDAVASGRRSARAAWAAMLHYPTVEGD